MHHVNSVMHANCMNKPMWAPEYYTHMCAITHLKMLLTAASTPLHFWDTGCDHEQTPNCYL